MKHLLYLFIAVFSISNAYSQLVWVNVSGDNQFCPDDNRESTYSINDNFSGITNWWITCNRCEMKDPNSGTWQSSLSGVSRPNFGNFQVRWDEGNFNDAWIKYRAKGNWAWFAADRTDQDNVTLVENDPVSLPNVNPTISSSVSSLACGSTSSVTFTANWKNANSYNWTVTGGSISGSSTGATITVNPTNGSADVKAYVKGYNAACGVYSPQVSKTISRNAPSVSAISGPDNICLGAPSIENHSVNFISGALYNWNWQNNTDYTEVTGNGTRIATIKGNITGNITIKLKVEACGDIVYKSKSVYSNAAAPIAPYLYNMPYQHCAGACEEYTMEVPYGYAAEYQYKFNYGYWQTADSDGSFYLCTDSYDYGNKTLELRAKGICGNYSTVRTESIYIDYCYMMAMTAEDSLAMTKMTAGSDDVVLYPNPATTSMSVSLPDEMTESEIAISNDKSKVIARFKNDKNMFAINTEKLKPGIYYLIIANKDKKITKRFLVK